MSTKPGIDDDGYADEEDESSNDTDDEDIEEQQKETMKKINLDHIIFVHVFDQVIQDSGAVLSILQDILVKVNAKSDDRKCLHEIR